MVRVSGFGFVRQAVRSSLILMPLVWALGCHSAYGDAVREDSVEGYRRFLRAHPTGEDAEAARSRLADLEFERASKLHTLVGYKRFLEEFPESSKAPAARALLEGLRFNAARDKGTPQALRQFLRDHPEGAHRAEAEAMLAAAEIAEASREEDPERLRQIISEHPDDPRRGALQARLDDEVFRAAASAGAGPLLAYLRDFPAGTHRDQARALLLSLELEGLLFSGLLDQARAEAARSPLAASIPDLEARFRRAQDALALARVQDLSAQQALPSYYVRRIEHLASSLSAADPLHRWQAAEELGHWISVGAIDPLLDALRTARHPLVRQRAFDSLGRVLGALPRRILDYEVEVRLERLRAKAQDAEVFLAIAALIDLSGRPDAATLEYRRAFDPASPDPVVLRRIAQLRSARGQHYSAAVMARQLANWALEVAKAQSDPASSPLASARQLCAAVEYARFAEEQIREARAHPTEFPEDVLAFAARAQEARRLAEARLGDAELVLRTEIPHAPLCGDRSVAERLAEGERQRLAAIRALGKRKEPWAAGILRLANERDPSPAVREEAARGARAR